MYVTTAESYEYSISQLSKYSDANVSSFLPFTLCSKCCKVGLENLRVDPMQNCASISINIYKQYSIALYFNMIHLHSLLHVSHITYHKRDLKPQSLGTRLAPRSLPNTKFSGGKT